MSDELMRLVKRCKGDVSVTFNGNRMNYQSAAEYLAEQEGLDPADVAAMVANDLIVEVQFYPDTPVGFHVVTRPTLNAAVAKALEILDAS